MIKELRLQNFRGFDDHTIPLRATTIVIGKNNAGKSTIVVQRRLIRLVKGRYKQTIIATHSTEILAEVDPDQVLIVDRARKKSRFAPSLPAVQRVLDRIGSAHNLQLARLWSARRLLLVEGKDIAVLKHFQNTLFPESTEPFDAIPNNSIGGWGGWSTVIGSSMFMKNAVGEDIVTYCVLDSDYRTPSQIASRREEAQRYGIQLHIWSRKEIENYLLVPTAIQRVIDYGKKRKKNAPPVGEILAKIDEIADCLRDEVCDALANDFFAENKPAGFGGATRYARQRVLATWNTVGDKIVVIPGKRVLSLLSKWSQDEYGVSLSSSKLAPELRASEIDVELIQVVTAIEEGQTFPNN